MKNKFLLLGATALLSTGALMANADDGLSTSLETYVALFRPLKIEQLSPLYFGVMEAKNGAEITIGTDGKIDSANSTSEIIFYEDSNGVDAGEIKISGNEFDFAKINGATDQLREGVENDNKILSFSGITPLKDGDITCGEIQESSLKQVATVDSNANIHIKIGGKLILASNIVEQMTNADKGLFCKGQIVVTAFADEEP